MTWGYGEMVVDILKGYIRCMPYVWMRQKSGSLSIVIQIMEDGRKPTLGFKFTMGGKTISWLSFLQDVTIGSLVSCPQVWFGVCSLC